MTQSPQEGMGQLAATLCPPQDWPPYLELPTYPQEEPAVRETLPRASPPTVLNVSAPKSGMELWAQPLLNPDPVLSPASTRGSKEADANQLGHA